MHAPIVVGVDGSEGSQRALRWAVQEARRLGAPVLALHACWKPPELAGSGPDADAPEDDAARLQAGQQLVERMLADAVDDDVDVQSEVVDDHPAVALIDRSYAADRIVVGTRGIGGFEALLLGAITHQVVQHSRCPVVVVPPTG